MIISTDKEKTFNKFQHFFRLTLNNLAIERSFHNLINGIYEKLTTNILNGKILKSFPLR